GVVALVPTGLVAALASLAREAGVAGALDRPRSVLAEAVPAAGPRLARLDRDAAVLGVARLTRRALAARPRRGAPRADLARGARGVGAALAASWRARIDGAGIAGIHLADRAGIGAAGPFAVTAARDEEERERERGQRDVEAG